MSIARGEPETRFAFLLSWNPSVNPLPSGARSPLPCRALMLTTTRHIPTDWQGLWAFHSVRSRQTWLPWWIRAFHREQARLIRLRRPKRRSPAFEWQAFLEQAGQSGTPTPKSRLNRGPEGLFCLMGKAQNPKIPLT